jgi:glycosyltransferase involved in cell wall biosynthesis
MRPSLAVVLITRDAAHILKRTLDAVSWADSILVVDSGSTDGTRELAEKLGARVVLRPEWKGYGHQKSYALSLAEGDWILMLDADEVVDSDLAYEIRRVTATRGAVSGYSMLRVNFFGSDRVRFGHSRPSYVARLFQKGKGRISDHRVHERVLIEGPVERLKGELHHYTSESVSHRVRKNDEYAAVAAEDWYRQGKRASLTELLLVFPLSLLRDLFFKGGILEGKRGLVLATLGAFYSFSKQAKLWEMERQALARKESHD